MTEAPAAPFLRRQVVLAVVAGGVVLVAVVVVGAVMAGGHDAGHAALRPAADGSGVTAVSPMAESSRAAIWVAGAALVAVVVVLALALDHVVRVARFAAAGGRRHNLNPDDAGLPGPAQEDC